jgi:hypothetical protein
MHCARTDVSALDIRISEAEEREDHDFQVPSQPAGALDSHSSCSHLGCAARQRTPFGNSLRIEIS